MLTGSAPGRDMSLVHALFHQDKFEASVDWHVAFYDAAVLATRLMNSPQGLQHDYCFFFGTNTPTNLPPGIDPACPLAEQPTQYSCDKGIGELTAQDIAAVQAERLTLASRIRYQVRDLLVDNVAETQFEKATQYMSETGSLVLINKNLYNLVVVGNHTREDEARIRLQVAITLLHEVAHAAHNHLFGMKIEDFREESIVAEAGYELEARLFGLRPSVKPNDPSDGSWKTWQYWRIESEATMERICRDKANIPEKGQIIRMDVNFVLKLCDDGFWSGEYARDGALALLPWATAEFCREEQAENSHDELTMPQSISDLFRSGGPSYAKVLYSQSANPGLLLRIQELFPVAKLDVPKAGKRRPGNGGNGKDGSSAPKNPRTPTKKPDRVTKQPAKRPTMRPASR
jgi:hypothetical protein